MPLSNPTLVSIESTLQRQKLGVLHHLSPVSGGCINHCYELRTDSNHRFFLKTHNNVPADFFACEANNLQVLATHGSLRIPEVIAYSESFLLLEFIEPGQPNNDYWATLGAGLAELHHSPLPKFGFHHNNFCGTTPQPNSVCNNGYTFFAEHRLRYQLSLATQNGLMKQRDTEPFEHLIEQLPQLLPDETARLVHGDLWSGNIYCDSNSQPVLIDPACYWGWRETDIAMTRLFGQLPATFYQSYQQALALQPDWQQRMDIYNLYHLLNHVNLFGQSYLPQVRQILNNFV